MEIGKKISELRNLKGISQEILAEQVGVSRQSISKWEREQAKPSSENLTCLANFFNITVEELLDTNKTVGILYNSQEELIAIVKNKKNIMIVLSLFITFLLLFIPSVCLEMAGFNRDIIFILVTTSGAVMFTLFLFVVSLVMRYVYKDCKHRGIPPTFFVIISFTIIGLLFYLLYRDSLSKKYN